MDQRAAAVGKRGHRDAVGVSTAGRGFSRAGQDQRPRHNHRPQAQHSSKHI